MQDGQHRSVRSRIKKSIAVPRCRERAGLRLAVAHDAGDNQVRVVERGAVRVSKGIAEFATLMNGARRFRRRVARNAAREGKLPEETTHSVDVLPDRRIDFTVASFKIGVCHHGGTAMAGTADIDDVEVTSLDDAAEMSIDEIEPWR